MNILFYLSAILSLVYCTMCLYACSCDYGTKMFKRCPVFGIYSLGSMFCMYLTI